jgi:hypothetical protein
VLPTDAPTNALDALRRDPAFVAADPAVQQLVLQLLGGEAAEGQGDAYRPQSAAATPATVAKP